MGGPKQDDASQVAVALRDALERRTPQAFEPLLDQDVRWGGVEDTDQTCHGRADVLAFYSQLLTDGTTLDVRDMQVEGERIRLQVRVGSTSDDVGTFDQPTVVTVRGGLIVDVVQLDPLDA